MIYKAPQSIRTKLHYTNISISGIYTILRIVCYIWCSALPMLRCSSFLAYTPNWPVALFLLLLHPPGTLYLLTFDCAKTFSLSNATWKPICSNSLVLLCCIKRLCIFGPKGAIQIRYYYYWPTVRSRPMPQEIRLSVCNVGGLWPNGLSDLDDFWHTPCPGQQ